MQWELPRPMLILSLMGAAPVLCARTCQKRYHMRALHEGSWNLLRRRRKARLCPQGFSFESKPFVESTIDRSLLYGSLMQHPSKTGRSGCVQDKAIGMQQAWHNVKVYLFAGARLVLS